MAFAPALDAPVQEASRRSLGELRGTAVAFAVMAAAILILSATKGKPISYFDVSTISATAVPLSLAAIGETIVILCGGLDLSVGAVISLVNVLIVTRLSASPLSPAGYAVVATLLGIGTGALIGAVNGFLVGILRLQSIVVTLATMFIAQGAVLLILKTPGGEVPNDFSLVYVGDLLYDYLPAPVLVAAIAVVIWLYVKNTRFGVALYGVGSDASAAEANGVTVRLTRFLSFVVGGAFFGWAGVALTANVGAGDPLIGDAMLLKVLTAVVLGGVIIGGGRGGAVGPIFGAVTLIVNIFLILGVRTYYVPIVESGVLLLAVLGLSINPRLPAIVFVRHLLDRPFGGRRSLPRRSEPPALRGSPPAQDQADERPWLARGMRTLRLIVPSYALLGVVVVLTAFIYGGGLSAGTYLTTFVTFATFLAVLALGQGAVIVVGGLDLSVPWAITFPALMMTTFANTSDAAVAWAVPLALAVGALIGLLNGALIVGAELSPIIATLAVGGLLEGTALVISGGAPIGVAPPIVSWFVNGRLAGIPPIAGFAVLFCVGATLLLNSSGFGRWIFAVGNSQWAAKLSGVPTGRVVIAVYVLSGLCSAIVGLLLVGLTSQVYFGMGNPYLLASIAAVILGGTSITGGRGHYIGMLGGALLFTALGSMLSGTTLPEAVRDVIYGCVILFAVATLRD
jgi:ribose transport system permease protein